MKNKQNVFSDKLIDELRQKDSLIVESRRMIIEQSAYITHLENMLQAHQNSFWWKLTKPARLFICAFKNIMIAISGTSSSDSLWKLSKSEKNKQQNHIFPKKIKFSILVPLYNTPKDFLLEMFDSISNQTYSNWEICLADGSDEDYDYIRIICEKLSKKHKDKVLYKKLDKNLGISENTNECIKMSTGEYLLLLDHDDALHPSALYENMKAICEKNADFIYSDECIFREYLDNFHVPFYKPDFSPDTLRGCNYICHLSVFSKELLKKVGLFRSDFDGSQDYDLILRLTEQAETIIHIPKILYFWRVHPNSVTSGSEVKPYAYTAAVNALNEHLLRVGLKGTAAIQVSKNNEVRYRITYEIEQQPLVSIIIPNKDNVVDLSKCLQSIIDKTTYINYEILIIENNSTDPVTFEYYELLKDFDNVKVLTFKGEFNYSATNNFAVSKAIGEYVVLLNNDTEIISGNWLEEMLMFAQRSDVGAVGAMLYYPDGRIQHAGVVLGLGGIAGHYPCDEENKQGSCGGQAGRLVTAQNVSCVTAACMMLPKNVFEEVGGLNEAFRLAFNDIDLCMKIRKAGYLVIWTPYAELYHYESKTRGFEDTPEKQERFKKEKDLFYEIWTKELKNGDPYYNINLSLYIND